jgi:hypothetical protein
MLLCVWVAAWGALAGSCDEEAERVDLPPAERNDAGSDASTERDAQTARDAATDARTPSADGALPPVDAALPPPPPPPDGAMPPPPDGAMPPPDAGQLDAEGDAGSLDAGVDAGGHDAGVDASAVDGGACLLTANTYTIDKANTAGCNLLLRDSTGCQATRMQAGLSGFWLKFSCRVELSVTGSNVVVTSDNQPDYKSNYFLPANVCYELYTGAIQNPNRLSAQTLKVQVPRTPGGQGGPKMGDVVGMALNGVAIFGNFAAPQDDIYTEARTFDRCGAHPQNTGKYHYHAEPYSITQDDSNFIGVLLDGSPVYGRRDADGTLPSNLDSTGGHTGTTPDSATAVYHYHVNLQTSTNATTIGDMQWFLTKGMTYHGAAGSCVTCTM